MAVTDHDGHVDERYDYGDFGLPLDPATLSPLVGTNPGIGNPLLFQGRRHDGETGWYVCRRRYLDPSSGRFVSRDLGGAWADPLARGNPYAFAGSNGLRYTDPLGLEAFDPKADYSAKQILEFLQSQDPTVREAATQYAIHKAWRVGRVGNLKTCRPQDDPWELHHFSPFRDDLQKILAKKLDTLELRRRLERVIERLDHMVIFDFAVPLLLSSDDGDRAQGRNGLSFWLQGFNVGERNRMVERLVSAVRRLAFAKIAGLVGAAASQSPVESARAAAEIRGIRERLDSALRHLRNERTD